MPGSRNASLILVTRRLGVAEAWSLGACWLPDTSLLVGLPLSRVEPSFGVRVTGVGLPMG